MRHFSYGALSHATITNSFNDLIEVPKAASMVKDYAYEHSKVLFLPTVLFIRGDKPVKLYKKSKREVTSKIAVYLGTILCYGVFGTVTMVLLMVLIGVIHS